MVFDKQFLSIFLPLFVAAMSRQQLNFNRVRKDDNDSY